ncbi:hypothetical protein PN451_04275 [Dolichospermum planctonicum CS-1226]|uniref:DNA (cytosine-5-)-methyltransferase n=1 Tax=Dolichospermum planctonicum CS-1226 TaxID=3021751 RepID=A0ABT5AF77_9CYAN|nr:hypothetical protein [Dolichospermum planctonicum]MDB9535070.1 hypothetical protein [Dolichospermum planctonicum CS-1226]
MKTKNLKAVELFAGIGLRIDLILGIVRSPSAAVSRSPITNKLKIMYNREFIS